MASASKPALSVGDTLDPRCRIGRFISRMFHGSTNDGRGGVRAVLIGGSLRLEDDDDDEDLDPDEPEGLVEERDLPLEWVSRCCFMLSARVNFLVQPGWVHGTAFSAVWILEWREACPEVVKVLSQPCASR
jgi:hypothetical protein